MSVLEHDSSGDSLLREAIREAIENTRTASDDERLFWWGSLQGIIRSDRDRQILREETAPTQVEVDLHLGGAGVDGHTTRASDLGALIQKLSESTKHVAKQIAGAGRWPENLLVEGVAPGSVRVILRAPESRAEPGHMVSDPGETADSKALRRVASLLTLASSEDLGADDDPLTAATQDLSPEAKESLRLAAQTVVSANWEIDGQVRRWREPEEQLRITRRGATRLRDTLALKVPEPTRVTFVGTLDGFRRSVGVAFIRPNGEHAAQRVVVSEAKLFHEVALLAAHDGLPVSVDIDVWQATRADGQPGRVSRRLFNIKALGTQGELDV